LSTMVFAIMASEIVSQIVVYTYIHTYIHTYIQLPHGSTSY
jgi:hypothetical protein